MWGRKKPKPDTWSLRDGDLPSAEHRALEPLLADIENNAYYRLLIKEWRASSAFALSPKFRASIAIFAVSLTFLICLGFDLFIPLLTAGTRKGPSMGLLFLISINTSIGMVGAKPLGSGPGKKPEKLLGIRKDRMGDVLQTNLSISDIAAAIWTFHISATDFAYRRKVYAVGGLLSLAGTLFVRGGDRWFMPLGLMICASGWATSRHAPFSTMTYLAQIIESQKNQMQLKRNMLKIFALFFRGMLRAVAIVVLLVLVVFLGVLIYQALGVIAQGLGVIAWIKSISAGQWFVAFAVSAPCLGAAAGHFTGYWMKRRHTAAFEKMVNNIAQILEWTREDLFEKASARK